jgi:hypothetical protein
MLRDAIATLLIGIANVVAGTNPTAHSPALVATANVVFLMLFGSARVRKALRSMLLMMLSSQVRGK